MKTVASAIRASGLIKRMIISKSYPHVFDDEDNRKVMGRIDDGNFDHVFQLDYLTRGHPVYSMFQTQRQHHLRYLENNYGHNPFHNSIYATDVLQRFRYLIENDVLQSLKASDTNYQFWRVSPIRCETMIDMSPKQFATGYKPRVKSDELVWVRSDSDTNISAKSTKAVSLIVPGVGISTIGMLLQDKASGVIFGITCAHGLYPVHVDEGVPFMIDLRRSIECDDPWTRFDSGYVICGDNQLKVYLHQAQCFQTTKVDLALIPLPTHVDWSVFGFGSFDTLIFDVDPPTADASIVDDTKCFKIGVESGRTAGIIVGRDMGKTFGGVNFTDLISIYSPGFLESGDSGALLLSVDDGLTIPEGILFMSNEEMSYAFTIDSLMAAAGINRRSWNYSTSIGIPNDIVTFGTRSTVHSNDSVDEECVDDDRTSKDVLSDFSSETNSDSE